MASRFTIITVSPIFLTVLYFSDLETHQNLTPINLVSKDNTRNIQYVIFTSSRDNILTFKGRLYDSRVRDHFIVQLGLNVSSSAHNCGCVVNGGSTLAAI